MNWKTISESTNYSIAEDGTVINNDTGRIKKPYRNVTNGYMIVDLWQGGEVKKRTVHRLLATAFIPNPENKPTVDHKDGNRTNNSLENLRWATYSEQNSRFGTYGVRSEKIKVIDNRDNSELVFNSITDAARYFNSTISNISLMLKKGTYGKRGKVRYYKFEYIKNRNV